MTRVASPAGTLVFSSQSNRAQLSRWASAGRALRLTPGVYALDATLPPEAVARQHRLAVIAHVWPGAVLCGRSALSGAEPVEGFVYVAHPQPPRTADLRLPGLTVRMQRGPGQLPGDMSLPEGLWLSGPARSLVENVHTVGRPQSSQAGSAAVEDRLEELARTGGAGRVRGTLEQLDLIASSFDAAAVTFVRIRLVALLGTVTGSPRTTALGARLAGEPYDTHRMAQLEAVCATLARRAPVPRAARPREPRWAWLAFFEAYFSNFIEGTRFAVEEARAIAIDGAVPVARPADAHDVAATYRLAVDPATAARVPRTADDLLALLRERHEDLMAARPEKSPGYFKSKPNFAGGYRFVDPDLAIGTLRRGFGVLDALVDPFARAVAMMVLLTEVHPFDDGNGRLARLFVNAELSAAGQVRMVIPTVYRNNYLAALSGLSSGAGAGESLIAVLDFAQRWTAAVDWRTYEAADAEITASHAYLDPVAAENDGLRLQLPTR